MSSGANAGVSKFQSLNCLGKTGLREGALDKIESQGCKNGDDNFLAPASIENNKYYYIMINNYSNSKGYSILFNDETIELEDLSEEHSIISDVAFANNTICGSLINDIDELDLKSLKIFPNPVNEALTIDMSELSGITKGEMITFSIINESGASVLKSTKEFNKGEFLIDVSSLIIGNYFLYFELKGELVRKQFHKM